MTRIHQGVDLVPKRSKLMIPAIRNMKKTPIEIARAVFGIPCIFSWHSDSSDLPSNYVVIIDSPQQGSKLYLTATYQDNKGDWHPHPDPMTLLRNSWLHGV